MCRFSSPPSHQLFNESDTSKQLPALHQDPLNILPELDSVVPHPSATPDLLLQTGVRGLGEHRARLLPSCLNVSELEQDVPRPHI